MQPVPSRTPIHSVLLFRLMFLINTQSGRAARHVLLDGLQLLVGRYVRGQPICRLSQICKRLPVPL